MGCGNCGTGKPGGLPSGCKDHGACKSGGCNRLNVHDWLSLIPVADFSRPFPFIEVSFNHGSRKDYYKANNPLQYEKGEFITLEGSGGYDVGVVSVTGELVKLQMKKKGVSEKSDEIKKVLHRSTEAEIAKMHESKKQEKEMMIRARVIARSLNLDMKIAEVEVQADGKKATFFYTADDRVDFRELIKQFAGDFKVKVEMRQIGIRQEAAKVGGIGSCGRELCCSTWLNDFKSVSTTAARYQNLSINQTKLSGQCGRLKCCLNYELDTYMDALRVFPDQIDRIKTAQGMAYLQKKDIFKNLMWFSFEKSNTLYPLTIERVKEIVELNKKNIFPEELQAVEIVKKNAVAEKSDFVELAGQFSVKSLDRAASKKKKKDNSSDRKPDQSKQGEDRRNTNRNAGANNAKGNAGGKKVEEKRKEGNPNPAAKKAEGNPNAKPPSNHPNAKKVEGNPQAKKPEGNPQAKKVEGNKPANTNLKAPGNNPNPKPNNNKGPQPKNKPANLQGNKPPNSNQDLKEA